MPPSQTTDTPQPLAVDYSGQPLHVGDTVAYIGTDPVALYQGRIVVTAPLNICIEAGPHLITFSGIPESLGTRRPRPLGGTVSRNTEDETLRYPQVALTGTESRHSVSLFVGDSELPSDVVQGELVREAVAAGRRATTLHRQLAAAIRPLLPEDLPPSVSKITASEITDTALAEILPHGKFLGDQLRNTEEQLLEARQWARHGYEIGQKHCGWSDHGVAPQWLTEGWPPHIDSCEHLKHAADLEEAEAVRKRVAKAQKEALTDALGMDRLRDWDDILNAATSLRKQRDAQAVELERLRTAEEDA